MSEATNQRKAGNCSRKWTKALQTITVPILKPFLAMSHFAATHPKIVIVGTIVFSIGIMALGVATNFTQETDDDIWSPAGSKPVEHGKWIDEESNFPKDARTAVMVLHRDGKGLFGADETDTDMALESTKRLFESVDHFRNTPRYDELCAMSGYIHPADDGSWTNTCQIVSATTFWNDNTTTFKSEATSDEVVLTAMSADRYPSGGAVDHDQLIGYNKFTDNILTYGESYVTVIFLPVDKADDENSEAFSIDFEKDAIDRILELQEQWIAEEGNDYKVEIITGRSFEDEFGRSLTKDLPLLPLVFLLMSILCVLFFTRRDKVLSRGWMGFGAVITVLLAIIASFGLLFVIGVPFTSLTPLLPFIMFGVGLDAAFIISGAFARTDHRKNVVERVDDTMKDIGHTILLTTLTSSLAFALGAVSSIPAVRYLVIYAFPTIIIDFLFQITFFIAIIVIDQRRIEQNRRDCCFCCAAPEVSDASTRDLSGKPEQHFADRLMVGYAKFLLKPAVKWVVIAFFAGMLAFFSWRTSELRQYFDFTKIIPADSYIQGWWTSYNDYYEANGVRAGVYFRDVDFSSQDIQDQMESYVQELAAMPYSGENEPFSFWLRDFREFVASENIESLVFEEQIKLFLENPLHYDAHHEDIVLNEEGVMTASRTLIRLDNIDEENVLEVVAALELQRSISANQLINKDKDEWAFFTWAEDYYIWEFYLVSPDELRLTTIIGVVSVSFLALIFIPHWTAILFVGPIVAILYIDLLGFIELCGLAVNPVMYISTVMSIGLMVDFVMHVTLRYVETKGESRTQKTTETLETIGASVLIGGISTLLGVLPLALSSSEIFFTTFIIFFGLVLLGLLHGLILLPVLLSMFGPLDSISDEEADAEPEKELTQTGNAAASNSMDEPELDNISVYSTESLEV
ncbi:Pick C1-like protein 1 [Seminavis robusta]|uniref:Pick C1-like protein 1 n=1 Tax=Seminavis robusta TaxID=568900 RepID=A0A9N8DZB7_9STRA|nr:Pick C1-like protein 1 [Seminavis robusta]|eukprot:Sro395_g134140.1 Pick C1-like protein 1 (915) ;mRNA; f:50577-53421